MGGTGLVAAGFDQGQLAVQASALLWPAARLPKKSLINEAVSASGMRDKVETTALARLTERLVADRHSFAVSYLAQAVSQALKTTRSVPRRSQPTISMPVSTPSSTPVVDGLLVTGQQQAAAASSGFSSGLPSVATSGADRLPPVSLASICPEAFIFVRHFLVGEIKSCVLKTSTRGDWTTLSTPSSAYCSL